MATKYFLGTADGVAQVDTVQITGFDAATTYTITIGEDTVSVLGITDANGTAAALQAALAASTNPYFLAVTWSVATDTVTGTAADPGNPFVATSSVTGGTGTIGSVTSVTASSGPAHFDDARNWDGGTLPAAADDLIFENGAQNVCFGIEPTNEYDSIEVRKSFTGRVGLNPKAFTDAADGNSVSTLKEEYRPTYLKTGFDVLGLGQAFGISDSAGSTRIRIHNDQAAGSTLTVFDSASSGDGDLPAIQYLADHASADIFIRDCPGGCGVGVGTPGETATIGDVSVNTRNASTSVHIGPGVTLGNFTQNGGTTVLEAAATLTSLRLSGGTVTTEGGYLTTTVNLEGGTLNANSAPAAGNAITTLNMSGGTIDFTQSSEARTVGTLNPDGGSMVMDNAYVTLTAINEPVGERTISIT